MSDDSSAPKGADESKHEHSHGLRDAEAASLHPRLHPAAPLGRTTAISSFRFQVPSSKAPRPWKVTGAARMPSSPVGRRNPDLTVGARIVPPLAVSRLNPPRRSEFTRLGGRSLRLKPLPWGRFSLCILHSALCILHSTLCTQSGSQPARRLIPRHAAGLSPVPSSPACEPGLKEGFRRYNDERRMTTAPLDMAPFPTPAVGNVLLFGNIDVAFSQHTPLRKVLFFCNIRGRAPSL